MIHKMSMQGQGVGCRVFIEEANYSTRDNRAKPELRAPKPLLQDIHTL